MLGDPWDGFRLGDGLGVPVAIGGKLTPGMLLGAYRRAIFCQPRCDPNDIALDTKTYYPDVQAGHIPVFHDGADPYGFLWWSPAIRYVIPVTGVYVNRSLRKTMRTSRWTTTVDASLDGIMAECRRNRKPQWITDELVAALRLLKDAGWVHTLEVWDSNYLVGGLYGYAIGSVFIMESAFHLAPDAAKVAIADLASRAGASGITLLDTEVKSDYTIHLGAAPITRQDYLPHLNTRNSPIRIEPGRRDVKCLVE